MQEFINNILQFFTDIYNAIRTFFIRNSVGQLYQTFLDKKVLDGSLISTPITFNEILRFLLPIIVIFIILYLFVKFFLKLLHVFTK